MIPSFLLDVTPIEFFGQAIPTITSLFVVKNARNNGFKSHSAELREFCDNKTAPQ